VNPADRIRRDARTLAQRDPRLAADGIPLGIEVWGGGYAGVVRLILGQLVSIEAADAMWRNLTLRRCGFTAQKAANARAIGSARLDFESLDALADDDLVERLMTLRGVGRWTAECYLVCSSPWSTASTIRPGSSSR